MIRYAKYYTKIIKKVIDGSDDYVTKEYNRLKSIIEKGILADSSRDDFTIRKNILSTLGAVIPESADNQNIGVDKEEL